MYSGSEYRSRVLYAISLIHLNWDTASSCFVSIVHLVASKRHATSTLLLRYSGFNLFYRYTDSVTSKQNRWLNSERAHIT